MTPRKSPAPSQAFAYTGPLSGVTLRDAETGEQTEVLLHPGGTVELPQEHPQIVSMVAQGLLVPVESSTTARREAPAASKSTEKKEKA